MMPRMKTLNVIGAGRVGRTLGAAWARAGVYLIGDVYTHTPANARAALAFLGGGKAVATVGDMAKADVWLITSPDGRIAELGALLAQSGRLRAGDLVFHCSGALAAADLGPAAAAGALTASVHPLKTFADAATALDTFEGTYCVAEGDATALERLRPAFERIGGRFVTIAPAAKPLYHAASALVCNDLTALLEAGLRCYERAGIPREEAALMLAPLVRDTVANVVARGPIEALTGPVVRGDVATVALHLDELGKVDPRITRIYRELSLVALELARARRHLDPDVVRQLEQTLQTPHG